MQRLELAGLGRIADGMQALDHLQVDHRVALALAEDHGLARGVAQPLEHRCGALDERVFGADVVHHVEHAPRRIERARAAQRVQVAARGQRRDDGVAGALGHAHGFGQFGERQRALARLEGFEDVDHPRDRGHGDASHGRFS
ncbi:hypothetical protein D9M72_605540 [compost metagenome]